MQLVYNGVCQYTGYLMTKPVNRANVYTFESGDGNLTNMKTGKVYTFDVETIFDPNTTIYEVTK